MSISEISAERGPGQSLEALIRRVPVHDLEIIIGKEVMALLEHFVPGGQIDSIRVVALNLLRGSFRFYMEDQKVRAICFDAMSPGKLRELASRVRLGNLDDLRALNPTSDSQIWSSFLGFFGIDSRNALGYLGDPEEERIAPSFRLFSHQRRVAEQVYAVIKDGYERVLLHMPTGSGKTRTMMHVLCRYLVAAEPTVVIWLASSKELLEQAGEAFREAWQSLGNRELSILRYWGDYDPDISACSDGLIVAGFQKIYARTLREPLEVLRLGRRVGLVVVDEAHQAIAPSYREVIDRLVETGFHSGLVGLSATPGRSWTDISADAELAKFFGSRKVMLQVDGWQNPVNYLIEEGYLAKPTFTRISNPSSIGRAKRTCRHITDHSDYNPEVLDLLARQIGRNVAIVLEVQRLLAAKHRRIIVFAATVQHAEVIAATLTALGIDSSVITAASCSTDRTRVIKEFRRDTGKPMVVCNFGVLTTGFDAPKTSAAVIARPTKSLVLYSQMVGRAIRGPRAGGNSACEIATVVDTALTGFGDVADAFTNWEDVWDE